MFLNNVSVVTLAYCILGVIASTEPPESTTDSCTDIKKLSGQKIEISTLLEHIFLITLDNGMSISLINMNTVSVQERIKNTEISH